MRSDFTAYEISDDLTIEISESLFHHERIRYTNMVLWLSNYSEKVGDFKWRFSDLLDVMRFRMEFSDDKRVFVPLS